MNQKTLEQIIKEYVQLQSPNPKGWQAVQCQVCHDHTRKGLRGSFLFDNDTTVYKCFNCGHAAVYSPDENEYMSKNMITVMDAFNIPSEEWQRVIQESSAWQHGAKRSSTVSKPAQNIEPKEMVMPHIFYFLKDAEPSDDIADAAREYLIKERQVNPDDQPWMLARKAENPRLHKWLGRVIMPIYKDKKLIYYVGRAFYDAVKKYETPAAPKEKILYGFDKLFVDREKPLIIVEGIFDAMAIDGIATLGNIITPFQAQWLNRSQREKIYVPDKMGAGRHSAEQALELGWNISTPDIGSNCKDMDDAVKKYGKMYVIKSIMDNKSTGYEAEVKIREYCDEKEV